MTEFNNSVTMYYISAHKSYENWKESVKLTCKTLYVNLIPQPTNWIPLCSKQTQKGN
jgi:hypothetical protein